MIRYAMDDEAFSYLGEWSEEFRTQTKWCPYYDKRAQMLLTKEPYVGLTAYFDATSYGYKMSLISLQNDAALKKGTVAKAKITHPEDGGHDFSLAVEVVQEIEERAIQTVIHAVQVFCTAFVEANAFMWYGNCVDDKKYRAAGANESDDVKMITFRKYKETVYAIPVGQHRHPDGIFKVRGHFRRYKSGKVVWIDEYLKGI